MQAENSQQTQLQFLAALRIQEQLFTCPGMDANRVKDLPLSVKAQLAEHWGDLIVGSLLSIGHWGDAELHEEETAEIYERCRRTFDPALADLTKEQIRQLTETGANILNGRESFPVVPERIAS